MIGKVLKWFGFSVPIDAKQFQEEMQLAVESIEQACFSAMDNNPNNLFAWAHWQQEAARHMLRAGELAGVDLRLKWKGRKMGGQP
jgi:hypothetical protein